MPWIRFHFPRPLGFPGYDLKNFLPTPVQTSAEKGLFSKISFEFKLGRHYRDWDTAAKT